MSKHQYLGTFELAVMLALIRLGDNAYGITISREIEEIGGREVTLGSRNPRPARNQRLGLLGNR
jgi:PadR family transcriptional regulator PadR